MKKLLLLLLAASCGVAQTNTPMLTQSTLTTNVLANSGLVNISAPFPFIPSSPLNQGVIYLDSEAMLVLSANLSLNQLTVMRGYLGTTAAAHNAGALAFSGQPFQFVSADKTGSCDPNSPQYLNVTDQSYFTCTAGAWVSAATSNGGGGAGNPGGTNGQIQFNNNGVFGGITPTGTGNVVKATSPTLVTPALGTPSTLVLTNATGLPGGQITGANSIPAATLPLATSSAFGAVECGSGTTCTAGVISASGSGGGFIVTNTAGLPGTCPAAGTAYFVTDQPKGQQAYYCADNTSAPYQSVNLGGSTCLAFTAGSLDIVTACLPQKTAANDFTALNRYAGLAGLGSAPAITFTTGTGSIASTSTNLDGVITSTTTGPIGFTLTWNTLTYAHRGVCMFANETTHANAVTSNAANTTTLSADGTVTTGDVITYICTGN